MAAELCRTALHRLRHIFGVRLDRSRTFGVPHPCHCFPVHFDSTIRHKSSAQNHRRIFGVGEASACLA
jgi:hypothetical protein